MSENANIQVYIKQLSVGYGDGGKQKLLLEHIDSKLFAGELVALIGANGSGKSTLLRNIVGLQEPISGRIAYNINHTITTVTAIEKKLMARQVAWVSTEWANIPNLKVFDLVAFGRYPYLNWMTKFSAYDRQIINQSIAAVGLNGFENKPITQISDGERQRAVIARALAQNTPVIILDEPTAYLDIENKYEIFVLLKELAHKNNKTILLSSHDLNIVMQEADRIWMVHEKQLFQETPEDLVLSRKINKLFSDPNLIFDLHTGDFRYNSPSGEQIYVNANGMEAEWTKRALVRKGYALKNHGLPEIRIYRKANALQWNLTDKRNQIHHCSTVYQLLNILTIHSKENL